MVEGEPVQVIAPSVGLSLRWWISGIILRASGKKKPDGLSMRKPDGLLISRRGRCFEVSYCGSVKTIMCCC